MHLASVVNEGGATDTVRLSEILGALSHALDLTEGQPSGHCVRATWIAVKIGHAMALGEEQLRDVYFTTLMKDLGCSSNAARICELYLSDDIAFKRDSKTMGESLPSVLGFVFSHTGLKAGLAERLKAILNILQNGGTIVDGLIETRCERGAAVAASLRLPATVCDGIRSLDEHWNGAGRPDRLRGDTIPLPSRLALLAQVVDVFHRSTGHEAALAEARRRSGTWFDPDLVAVFLDLAEADEFWTGLEAKDLEAAVFDMEPAGPAAAIDEDYLDDIARAFAHVIDSKSPFTSGHSERVAVYADLVAAELGYDAARRRWLRRAALLHDIGKLGVSNAVLDKPGKLDDEQWREMREHATLSESILWRVAAFRDMARIGGAHHERLDGRGYPRGLAGDAIALDTRIVSVADVFDALTADRPYRAAMPVERALGIMRKDLGLAFDPICFAALERALVAMEAQLGLAA
ncbi:HD-GYP domain-containing protein [Lichenibacterium dinghuense]|uniref:HD-GYP domain-containing protein n=1 Tax=Lichenibacterium dinghuense TaxID=2895977 RepID=UPI001F1C8D5E|nr:HD domain-containing protein [Lichenibacterium sp. 6Y81]